jgi:hypothetical protein
MRKNLIVLICETKLCNEARKRSIIDFHIHENNKLIGKSSPPYGVSWLILSQNPFFLPQKNQCKDPFNDDCFSTVEANEELLFY